MNREQFLPKDARQVVTEIRAAMDCISRSEFALMNGDLETAELFARDFIKSVRVLKKLEQEKEEIDAMISNLEFLLKNKKAVGMVVLTK